MDMKNTVPTGLSQIDALLGGGLPKGSLTIVASRTGIGKSAFVQGMARTALFTGFRVGVFSPEMLKRDVEIRHVAALARIGCETIWHPDRQFEEERNRSREAKRRLAGAGWSCRDGSMSITDIQDAARQESGERGLDLIVVDCLLQVELPGGKFAWKKEKEPIVKALKGLAAALNAAVVLTSQLDTRTLEDRPGHQPVLDDLSEFGGAAEIADVVVFLHRPDVYAEMEPGYRTPDVVPCEAIVARNLHGGCGTVDLDFYGPFVEFTECPCRAPAASGTAFAEARTA